MTCLSLPLSLLIVPHYHTLLFSGGWSFGTKKFKDMTSNRYNRRKFVFSVSPYLREHNFDGLDLDWEYPKGATDKANFAKLCEGQFGAGHLS